MHSSRRDFLRITAAGVGLSFAIPGLEPRAADRRGDERAKSFLTIWLGGGPSQLETWDPHPRTRIGGDVKAISTTIPGCQISDFYPHTAEQLHHLSVIRSLVSKEGDHERASYMLHTGYRPEPTLVHPSIGAIATHERPEETVEIPQFVSLGDATFPPRGGFLGNRFDAYRILNPGERGQNLVSLVDQDRQTRRLENLSILSRTFARGRQIKAEQTLHQHTIDAARRMMTSDQLKAFSVEHEPKPLRDAYGDNAFGRGCLVARRLLETGVRSIEVSLEGFDTHTRNHEGQAARARTLDPALSTLLKDLADRDLLQSTVVLVTGEFGRTPNMNPLEGRDHWPNGFSCLLGGGGLVSGLVIGSTDPEGTAQRPDDPIEVADLYATVLHRLGIEYAKEIVTPIGRPMKFCSGKPIERLSRS
ncbi:DUF1501 domain-containing protein [Schlesneria paludicola]|uniref:DUF1501 domain-containing protein n=1 Tax=Schlesneria paludicola TaxID=360056 RepID=UPI001ED96F7E|nr:DUF1501 domain-containing protein [Schlesneria paludicola]